MITNLEFNCCGCSACTIQCPSKCLHMEINNEGFYSVISSKEECLECGVCEKVCPMLNKEIKDKEDVKAFSVYSKSDSVRKSCSSGGIAYEISRLMLSKGYKVLGVKYNYELDIAETKICSSEDELEELKGSKYLQSINEFNLKEIFDGNKYVVFGTPCQISGIKNIVSLKKKLDNFIFIDFFCHGVPSYLLWKQYLREKRKRYKITKLKEVRFRDKKNGWHNFTLKMEDCNKKIYSDKDRDGDMFYRFFLGNQCLNLCCYNCKFRLTKSDADIRIGDMWGEKYKDDIKGISGVLVNTQGGESILQQLTYSCEIKDEYIGDVCEGQMKQQILVPKYRKKVINGLEKKRNFRYIYTKYILCNKIRRKILRIVRGI